MAEIDPLGPEYTYMKVANDLAARITAGEFTVRLPSQRTLAAEYKVGYQTLRRSMEVLRGRGMIVTRQGWAPSPSGWPRLGDTSRLSGPCRRRTRCGLGHARWSRQCRPGQGGPRHAR